MKYMTKNTKKFLRATLIVVAGFSLTIPFTLHHINVNNKTINLSNSSLKQENNNEEILGYFDGMYLDKLSITALDWLNLEVILESDWFDAHNVIQIGPEVNLDQEVGIAPFLDTNIRSIYIPSRIQVIGEYSFMNSTIEHLNFEENSNLEFINDFAFKNTMELLEINLPSSIKKIGIETFSSSSVETVDFGENSQLKIIKAGAFKNSKLANINIPDSVLEIEEEVFLNIPTLLGKNISMPNKLKGDNPHQAKYGLTQEQWDLINWRIIPFQGEVLTAEEVINIGWTMKDSITLSDWDTYAYNVKKIDHFTFENSNITSIEIPIEITIIGDYAFSNTTQLSIIKINPISELTSIGNNAFENSAITSIEIPNNVNFIGENTFINTNSLTLVTLPYDLYVVKDPETPKYGLTREQWDSILLNAIPNQGMICEIIAEELLKENNNVITWDKISFYDGIEEEAFRDTNITEIIINYKEGFTIGRNAFAETDLLNNIELSAMYKDIIDELGFSKTQINNIKYPLNDSAETPESNNVGLVAGVLITLAVGFVGFLYGKNKKIKKSLATAELLLEAQISSTNITKIYSKDD
ncbi:MAG: leucine-rich repeat protein [Metamycoplasmataceae bacterium]